MALKGHKSDSNSFLSQLVSSVTFVLRGQGEESDITPVRKPSLGIRSPTAPHPDTLPARLMPARTEGEGQVERLEWKVTAKPKQRPTK